MNNKIIIIGNGSFAKLVYYYLTEYSAKEVCAFSVDNEYIQEKRLELDGKEIPVVPFESLNEFYPATDFDIILGIGYSQMNDVRKKMFFTCKAKGYNIASFIHPTCVIAKNVILGEGNIILENSIIQPFVKIGNGNLLWHNVKISHDDKIGDFNMFAQNASLSGFVNVGQNCFFGNSSVVLDRKNIADYTLVGAGAIVKHDTKPYDVIVPAKSVILENYKSIDFM